jgi:hypothetical protein
MVVDELPLNTHVSVGGVAGRVRVRAGRQLRHARAARPHPKSTIWPIQLVVAINLVRFQISGEGTSPRQVCHFFSN